ncbi:MAG: hypothetical protein RIG68_22235 [Imperialibacter sp.]|uniref:hypothetical protein n=1 Tax=Imperialibacter sp. TaxID=2038411 RepID=UPI0032EF7610
MNKRYKYFSGKFNRRQIAGKDASPAEKNEIEDFISKSLKIAPALLIVIGYFDLHSYYNEFGITIYNYIDSFELLLRFTPFLYTLIVVFLGAIFTWLYYTFRTIADEPLGFSNSKRTVGVRNKKRVRLYFISLMTLVLTGILSVVGVVFQINNAATTYPSRVPELALSGYFILISFFVLMIVVVAADGTVYEKLRNWFVFVFLFTMAIGYVLAKNKISANNVINGKPRYTVEFKVDEETIKSDTTTLLFIGNVRNHTFLLDRKNDQVLIYRNSEIKLFTLKELRKEQL